MNSIETANGITAAAVIITLAKWRKGIGISDTTGWRWARAGWIHPINIAGRPYLRAEDILEFERRAAAGEFAKPARGAAAKKGSA